MNCRSCEHPLKFEVIDLGQAPFSNAFLSVKDLASGKEPFYSLKVLLCENCWLMQNADYIGSADVFTNDYVYFSSFSKSWLNHAEKYVDAVSARFSLTPSDQVVEIASNDGYLLQYFAAKNFKPVGVEPCASVADAASSKGIKTYREFFALNTAKKIKSEIGTAKLIIANNVLAHVPDINDFVAGFKELLHPEGVVTFEFPHVLELLKHDQFDTIYHEHFSYLSLLALTPLFARHGLEVFDVQKLCTHGGSLRLFVKHLNNSAHPVLSTVTATLQEERNYGLNTVKTYTKLAPTAAKVKIAVLKFLTDAIKADKKVYAYGAAAKGNTLLNYCGVHTGLLSAVADASTAKQGLYLPGSHVPVLSPRELCEARPNYVWILPWNIKDEVASQLSEIRQWQGEFVVFTPDQRNF